MHKCLWKKNKQELKPSIETVEHALPFTISNITIWEVCAEELCSWAEKDKN